MNTMLPIAIIVLLGAISSLVVERLRWNLAFHAVAAALLATVIWVSGCNLLMAALGEVGPPDKEFPVLTPILLTFVTALAPALLVGWMLRMYKANAKHEESTQETASR